MFTLIVMFEQQQDVIAKQTVKTMTRSSQGSAVVGQATRD